MHGTAPTRRDVEVRRLAAEALEASLPVPQAPRRGRRHAFVLWPFLGPAFVACIAYIDPGNFATNIQGGSAYGYRLVWVVVVANLVGMFVQMLSAKLGVVTGRNLP